MSEGTTSSQLGTATMDSGADDDAHAFSSSRSNSDSILLASGKVGCCDFCGKKCNFLCSGCNVTTFCGKVCMKGGWKTHKAYCRMSNPEKWQFMVQNAQTGTELSFTSMSRIISSEGVDLNTVDEYGWTMMHRMTENNEIAFVKLLLEAGASADLPLQGIAEAPPSALMMCAMNVFDNASLFPQGGKVDLARILIDHGADLEAVFTLYGDNTMTPLTAAIHNNCPVIADMLIDGIVLGCCRSFFVVVERCKINVNSTLTP